MPKGPTIDVAIVGAGAAGVGAARALVGRAEVLLLEAGPRVGGRARTDVVAGVPLDLGCSYLHSADRNPWVAIAHEQGRAVDRRDPAWREQYRDLGFSRAAQRAAGEAWAAFDQRLRAGVASDRAGDALDPASPWTPYIEALSGYINGAEFERVSVADYLAYDDAATDENWRLPGGYGALVAAALPAVPVRLNTPVTRIDHRGATLRLETPAGAIEARRAIVAVPTTVLATGALAFDPPLRPKRDAAARLPLGVADKAFLALSPGHGLDADSHLLGNPRRADTGSYQIQPLGRPVIECFFGGRAAHALEADDMAAFAIDELAALLGSGIRVHLRPLATSAWAREPWIGGSYSHALPGQRAARAALAEPVDNRLFFAGEACSPQDFSTAHGALATGVAAGHAALAAGQGAPSTPGSA